MDEMDEPSFRLFSYFCSTKKKVAHNLRFCKTLLKFAASANVLIRNLRILHDHQILHNAISEQNYTWALELLDFELACSPAHPYTKEDDMRHVKELFPREIIQTYVIINYIAGVLREEIDYKVVDELFVEYGLDLKQYAI